MTGEVAGNRAPALTQHMSAAHSTRIALQRAPRVGLLGTLPDAGVVSAMRRSRSQVPEELATCRADQRLCLAAVPKTWDFPIDLFTPRFQFRSQDHSVAVRYVRLLFRQFRLKEIPGTADRQGHRATTATMHGPRSDLGRPDSVERPQSGRWCRQTGSKASMIRAVCPA